MNSFGGKFRLVEFLDWSFGGKSLVVEFRREKWVALGSIASITLVDNFGMIWVENWRIGQVFCDHWLASCVFLVGLEFLELQIDFGVWLVGLAWRTLDKRLGHWMLCCSLLHFFLFLTRFARLRVGFLLNIAVEILRQNFGIFWMCLMHAPPSTY